MDTLKKLIKLTLVPTNESKEIIKNCEELWSKIRNLIRSITKNSDDQDEKLPPNKTIEIYNMTIFVRAILKYYKYYQQFFQINGCVKYKNGE